MSPTRGPMVPFDRRDGAFLAACALIAAVSVAIAVRYHHEALPEASLNLAVSREEAAEVARSFLLEHGFGDPDAVGRVHASAFWSDDAGRVFLERTLELEQANRLMSGVVPAWRWSHRWLTPLRVEEIRVHVAVDGHVVAADHVLAEEEPGARLARADALVLAMRFAEGSLGRQPADWELLDSETVERPARTDHVFTWKRRGLPELDAHGASLRATVRVAGDRVAGFGEHLDVPEQWQRDYEALRSRNETAGAVASFLLLLTFVAVIAVFLRESVRRNAPLRLAGWMAAIGAVLVFAHQLNALPLALHDLSTTRTLGSFVTLHVLEALASASGLALFIFLLTGAGEPLYRAAYPAHLALARTFTWRGLRTRQAFRGVVLGLALTCFFVAYQTVFYLLAGHLGAWAPQEVPYDDLLNTKFPWTAVLLIGFMPAVTEEFLSRLFSVPFLERWLRWRFAAVFVASFTWGFAHSSYPNQPFFIRGLEVGVAGVIVSYVMVRWGILATLTWHYTVDALYTGLLLLRSESWYYRITAGVAISVMVVPLGACLLAAWRRGGFESDEGLRNESFPPPPRAETAPRVVAPASPREPLARRFVVAALVMAAAAAVLLALPVRGLDAVSRVAVSRAEALAVAGERVRELGGDPDGLRSSAVLRFESDPTARAYLISRGWDVAQLVGEHRRRMAALVWDVRMFLPGQHEEWRTSVRADRSETGTWEERHVIAEDVPGGAPSEADAREAAAAYLRERGVDVTRGFALEEARLEQRPARKDWTFEWEDEDGFRHGVTVAGGTPSAHARWLDVPETFRRSRERVTLADAALMVVRVGVFLAFFTAALTVLSRRIMARQVPLRGAALAGAAVALSLALVAALDWPALLDGASTAQPWSQTLTQWALVTGSLALAGGAGGALLYGLVAALHPGRVEPLRGQLRDALVGVVLAVSLAIGLAELRDVLAGSWPQHFPPRISMPDASALSPALSTFAGWVSGTLLSACVAGIAVTFMAQRRTRWGRAVVVLLTAAALMPGWSTASEAVGSALLTAVATAGVLVVAAAWRGNALAHALGIGAVLGVRASASLLAQPLASLWMEGAIVAAAMLVSLAALGWRVRRRGDMGSAPATSAA